MKEELPRSVVVTEVIAECHALGYPLDDEWKALSEQYVIGALSLRAMAAALKEDCFASGDPRGERCQTRAAAFWLVEYRLQRYVEGLRHDSGAVLYESAEGERRVRAR